MDSRRLVELVLEGEEPPRMPLHVESDDKGVEARFGDVVGIGARIARWRGFYASGGPFHRKRDERLMEWLERVDPDAYKWPDPAEVAAEAVDVFKRRSERFLGLGKFLVFKVLGPTETAESFFASPMPPEAAKAGHIAHGYGFAVTLRMAPKKGVAVYERIASTLLEVVKAGAELDSVDAVRLADDVAGYKGPLYPRWFVEEHYLKWHERFSRAVRGAGKWALLHCDGDLRREGLLKQLAEVYDGIHPVDIAPKSTVSAALEWARQVAETRRDVGWRLTYFTGAPIDLIFDDSVAVDEFLSVPRELVKAHGRRKLVIATTHSEYPGRSYAEELPLRKLEALVRLVRTL